MNIDVGWRGIHRTYDLTSSNSSQLNLEMGEQYLEALSIAM